MYWDGEHWVDEAPRRPAKRSASATAAPRYTTLRSIAIMGTTLVMFVGFIVPWSPLAAASAGRIFGVPEGRHDGRSYAFASPGDVALRAGATQKPKARTTQTTRPSRPRRAAPATGRAPPTDRAAAGPRPPPSRRPRRPRRPSRPRTRAGRRRRRIPPPGRRPIPPPSRHRSRHRSPPPPRRSTARSTSRPTARTRTTGRRASPWKSLYTSIKKLGPGDTLYIREGTYSFGDENIIDRHGTASNPITIRAYPGETPTFKGNTTQSIFMWFRNAGYINVSGLTIYGDTARRTASATVARSSSTPATRTGSTSRTTTSTAPARGPRPCTSSTSGRARSAT